MGRKQKAVITLVVLCVFLNAFLAFAGAVNQRGYEIQTATPSDATPSEADRKQAEELFFTAELVEGGERPGLYGTLNFIPENTMSISVEYSFGGEVFYPLDDMEWDLNGLSGESGRHTQLCLSVDTHPLKAYLKGAVNRLFVRLYITVWDGEDIQTEAALFSHGSVYPVPEEPVDFDAQLRYSYGGYQVDGTFLEIPPDVMRSRPMYSLDGERYQPVGEEYYCDWDLMYLGSEDENEQYWLENQPCVTYDQEPLKSYIKQKLERFYIRLQITTESGVYDTKTVVIEGGELKPLPEDTYAKVVFPHTMCIQDEYGNPDLNGGGQYQITVKEGAVAEDILELLPHTLPVEVCIFQKEDNELVSSGIAECPAVWRLPQLDMTAGKTIMVRDAVEALMVPAQTEISTPLGSYQLPEALTFDDAGRGKVQLVIHVVEREKKPDVSLQENTYENSNILDDIGALSLAFRLKPSGADSIKAYYLLEGDSEWTEICDLLSRRKVDWNQSAAIYGYVTVLGSDETPFREYLNGDISAFLIGLSIEGGIFDGEKVVLPWPGDYDPPDRIPEPGGSEGNENDAGSAGNGTGGSSGNGGQRPGLPQEPEGSPDNTDGSPGDSDDLSQADSLPEQISIISKQKELESGTMAPEPETEGQQLQNAEGTRPSERTESEQTAPEQAVSERTESEQAVPEQAVSERTESDQAVPNLQVRQSDIPETRKKNRLPAAAVVLLLTAGCLAAVAAVSESGVSFSALMAGFLPVIALVFFFTLLYFKDNKYQTPPPYGRDGILTLAESDLTRNQPLFLIDGWLLTDSRVAKLPTYIGEFSNLQRGDVSVLPHGTATYQLTLRYSGAPVEAALDFSQLFTDYTITLDGQALSRGKLHAMFPFLLTSGDHVLEVHTDSQTGYYSGMYHPPALSSAGRIISGVLFRSFAYGFAFFLPAVLALFTLVLWCQAKEPVSLRFGMFCVSFSLYVSYYFVRLFFPSLGEYWYLVQSGSFYMLCFCVVSLVIASERMGDRRSCRFIQWGLAVSSFTLLLLALMIPCWPQALYLHGVLTDLYYIFTFCSVVFLMCLDRGAKNTERRFMLAACQMFGAGLVLNLLFSNRFEPILFFWQFEWCGLLLVLLFAAMMAARNRRILAENKTFSQNLELMVQKRTEELERLLQERKAFFSEVAHDLKAPVFATNAFIQAIRSNNTWVDEELLSYIDQVEQKQKEIARRVQGLNVFTQMDKIVQPRENVSVMAMLKEVYEAYHMAAEVASVHFIMELPDTDGFIFAQPEKLLLLFENLIFNALRATPPDGQITILAELDEEGCHIRVADTGRGMEADEVVHIFERFYVGKENKGVGSGLGLTIVKTIVEELAGEISVSSKPGNGTVFYVDLPLVAEAAVSD